MKYLIFLSLIFSFNIQAKVKHVVFIGIDGLGTHNLYRDEFKGVAAPVVPNINRLKSASAWTGNASIDERNWSGPNWVGMITGSTSDEHGVHSNKCKSSKNIPTVYQIIKEQMPSSRISVFYDWRSIKCHAGKGFVDKFKINLKTAWITKRVLRELKKRPTLTFVYYGKADTAGHSKGGHSSKYKNALEKIDKGVGEILDYLKSSGMDKETLVILTADHGHHPTDGVHSTVDFKVPLFMMGPGIIPGEMSGEFRNNQVAPIIAFALGLNPSPKWSSTIHSLEEYFTDL